MNEQQKLTEAVIAKSLVRFGSMFPPRRFLCVENVSWGLLPWEADLLCMSRSGFLQEVEIKISVADLRRDLEKDKHRFRHETIFIGGRQYNSWIKWFWYAMPTPVWDKVKDSPPIPEDAGVVVLDWSKPDDESDDDFVPQLLHRVARKPKTNAAALPLTDSEKFALARLGVLRYWDRLAA